ncbi:Predicted transporter (major facilitator superfamily) [Phaffia rhodozyma]|uniref:Predicted transporter (Major facilitator superfamily) n=1 Tax=Phaffia rhodozyma TaxID=264483 RepID=A0A0F7SG99_PHARH|nr:Predicted transporter (major facilitator superfamily) [Phaffia rhodozyma]
MSSSVTTPLLGATQQAKNISATPNYGTTVSDDRCATDIEARLIDPSIVKSQPTIEKDKPFREIALLCSGLWTSVFCSALNASITANLQVDIVSYFKAGHLASWLGGSYLLGVAALTPLWGRLSDIIGRRSAIICAMLLFTTGTLGCAIAPSMSFILGARLLAGCGGGGLLTITAIIISDLVSLKSRGLYQGYVNLLFGAGSATGAVLGGSVADKFGWRWAFGMQIVPLSVSFLLILWKVRVPVKSTNETSLQLLKRIDWYGFVSILTSITSLMVSLSLHTSSSLPWSHPAVYSLLIVFAISTAIFWYVEGHVAEEPLISLSLLKMKTPGLVLLAFMLLTMSTFARLFMIPMYLHIVRGYNGSQTGLILLPSSITGSAGSLFAGWYMRHTGSYRSLNIWSCLLPLYASLSFLTWGVDTNIHRMWIETAIASWGGGVVITTFLTALIASVDKENMAISISASYMFRSLGQVLGVTLTRALQQGILSWSLGNRLGHDSRIPEIIKRPSVIFPTLPTDVHKEAVLAYLTSIDAVFVFASIVGFTMMLCALGMRSYELPGR